MLVDATECADQIKEDFWEKLEIETKAWSSKFFSVGENSKRLCEEKSDALHSFAMKTMFLRKRGRPDVELGVSFLFFDDEKWSHN